MSDRLCVGVVVGVFGVKGQLRIKSFTADPADLTRYGPLETEAGQRWRLQNISVGTKAVITARIDEVGDRTAAEALKGTKLYVPREALPAPDEEEFYIADLIGLAAQHVDGRPLGKITAVFDFGAGDIIEVSGDQETLLIPFTLRSVPKVDIGGGRVIVDPPLESDESEDGPEDGPEDRKWTEEGSERD